MIKKIALDGMLSGTGFRNLDIGGYVDPVDLGISSELKKAVETWLGDYEQLHYANYEDVEEIERLDEVGLSLLVRVRHELPSADISYFSNALMKYLN